MIKKAGDKVSQILGISRFSLYNYLEEGRSRREESET
jgi:predicted transcriptional regulator YheO